jgi:hypothetical protein
MAKENEGQSLRDYGNRKKRYKRRRNFMIIISILIIAVVGIGYLYSIYNRNYQSYEVLKTTENVGENTAGYLSYGSSVVKYSKDGAIAYDKDSNLLWNGSYEMKDPIADTCGKYVVVADRGNKSIHIFNGKGAVGSITTLHNIIKVEVSSQGVVAVLMEEGETNSISLFDMDGTVLAEKITNVNEAGYPIDMALSNDGEKLVISYLAVTKGKLISTIAFFNFGEVGQNYTDRFVGGYEFEETVVPRVTFLDNDTVCAYKDTGFLIYTMKEIPTMIHEENLEDSTIQSVLYSSKYTGIVLESSDASPKKLLLYDLEGKKVLEKALDFDYEKVFLADEEIIMYDNVSCVIMKTNGKIKFRYTFDGNIGAFYPINDLDRYFLVNEANIAEIVLKE